jgi:5-methylcytosine-specific restriction protein A
MDLVEGQIYRRTDLHAAFGGQRQGGISTPSGRNVILLFTGASGAQHGYEDGWSGPVFCYFGEGQTGDMSWIRGNLAVRDHVADGKDLLLFEILEAPRSHVRYLGVFTADSFERRQAPASDGLMRSAIVFHLIRVDAPQPSPIETQSRDGGGHTLTELREAAISAARDTPQRSVETSYRTFVERSRLVRAYALARAAGLCELCGEPAPFVSTRGEPFLEVHHIHRLSDGGADRPDAVASLCPNCHRQAHFGENSQQINLTLSAKIRQRELEIRPA